MAEKGDYPQYVRGDPLEEDEYLIRLRESKAFMTKLTKKGQVPTSLVKWVRSKNVEEEIRVIQEEFRSGWEIQGARHGMSQSWIGVQHPHGFMLEITTDRLISILQEHTVINGTLQGKWKWFAVDAKSGDLVAEPQAGTKKKRKRKT